MKHLKYAVYLSLVLGFLMAFQSCGNKKTTALEKAYNMAVEAKDYTTATQLLTQWVCTDTTISNWAYDSLSYYHYFYNASNPNVVRDPKTAMYYTDKGLKYNPKSNNLRELKAKLLLEQGKDTASLVLFRDLWQDTKENTYWWDMCFVEMARGNILAADSMITLALENPSASKGEVRMEHIQARVKESVPSKAAYIYLQALIFQSKNDIMGAATAYQAALKIFPNFYAARQGIIDLQRMVSQQRR